MARFSKRVRFSVLVIILIACAATAAFGQDYWSVQKPMSCHPKLLSSVHGGIFQPQVKQYEWTGRVTNTYDQTVTFDMYVKVGNQKKTIGRFTVEPGKSTRATSYYYDDPSKLVEVSVDNVCFLKGGCKVSCYAGCDDGRSINQPSCDDSPKSPTSDQNQNPTNNTASANSGEAIKQKIKQNLEDNFRLSGVSNRQITFDGSGVTISWDSATSIGTIRLTYRLTFNKLAQAEVVNGQYQQLHFPSGNCSAKFVNSGSEAGCSDMPYNLGPNGQNFNELKALLAQLAGAPSTSQGSSSGAEAIKQKIVENLKANLYTGTDTRSNSQYKNTLTVADVKVQLNGNILMISSTSREQVEYETEDCRNVRRCERRSFGRVEQRRQTVDFDLAAFSSSLTTFQYEGWNRKLPAFSAKPLRCSGEITWDYTRDYNREQIGVQTTAISSCKDLGVSFFYNPGGGNQNFNELKALAAQLAGAPSAPQNSTGGTNNASSGSSAPSGATGANSDAPETLPQAAYNLSQAGNQQFNAKNYAAAVESYKKALEISPNSVALNYNLGVASSLLQDLETAANAFQKAVENRPTYSMAYVYLANMLDRLNRKEEAIEWLKKAVRAVPDNAQLWYSLGDKVSSASSSGADGLTFLQKSVELDPKCYNCQLSLAAAFAVVEQWDAAIRSYETVFRLAPGDGRLMPYGPLMNAYNKVGKYPEAVRLFLNLEAHADPSYKAQISSFVNLQLGIAYCGLKDKPKAMAILTKLKGCPTCSTSQSDELLQKIRATWPARPVKGRK